MNAETPHAKRLLIVDDDRDAAKDLGDALTEWFNCAITYTASGPETIAYLAANRHAFDVALIDQQLNDPRMDGIDTMREIFKLDPLLPVLLFTGKEIEANLRAIDEGAYLYLSIQKGDVSPSQLANYCQAAIHDRTRRWQVLFQEMSQALHSLKVERVLETCEQGLRTLGYHSGVIYRSILGWVVLETPLGEGCYATERRLYLRSERMFAGTVGNTTIDLSKASYALRACHSPDPVTIIRAADGSEQVLVPLRSEATTELTSENLFGLLMLYHMPTSELEPREEANLASLGQQVSLALQNALAYQQIEYRRATANQILNTNHRILAIEYGAGAAETILSEFAQTIAQALGFEQVLISTVNESANLIEHRGLAGFARGQHPPSQDRAVFEQIHRPEYRHPEYQRGGCYFFPVGCVPPAHVGAFTQRERDSSEVKPWRWQPHDQIRAAIVSARDKVLGYITVRQRRGQRRPDTRMFEALELFATQVAVAIENLNYQQIIEAIQQVSNQISRARDSKTLFKHVYQQLNRLMYADVMMIGRFDRDRNQIEVLYRRKVVPQERNIPGHYSVWKGLSGYIVRTGESLLFPTQAEVRAFHARHGNPQVGDFARSWMGVPLKVGNRVTGVIALKDYAREGVYSERDQRLLSIVADQIAITLRRIEAEKEQRDADLRATTQIGLEMVSGKSLHLHAKPQRAQRMMLEWACRLTGADDAVLLRYDDDDNSLVLSEGYVTHPDRDLTVPVIDPEIRLPLEPQPGERASLSVIAARTKDGKRWENAPLERNYYPAIPETQSQMSLPLLDPGNNQRLLGVLTLESRRRTTFDDLNRGNMRAIARMATQFVLGAREQQRLRSTLGRYMFDLGDYIIHHSYVSQSRGLSTNLETAAKQFVALLDDVQVLYDQAKNIPLVEDIQLQQRTPTRLNKVVHDFLKRNGTFYRHPTIELRATCYLGDNDVVYANPLGIGEALRILVDNAFEKLCETPYSGHEIVISTDRSFNGITLSVSNTGPPLNPRQLELVERQPVDWDASSQGLIKLKVLLSLYGAGLRVTQSDTSPVTFTITFPWAAPASTPGNEQAYRHIRQLQRGIAGHSALGYTSVVRNQAPLLEQQLQQLHDKMAEIHTQANLLRTDLGVKLNDRTPLVLDTFLKHFIETTHKRLPKAAQQIPIRYQQQLGPDVVVYASRVGLREALFNVVKNATEAISESVIPPTVPPQISISVEPKPKQVQIHIQNTGPMIQAEIANRLFEYEIQSKQGMGKGLLLSSLLLITWGGSIRLAQNDAKHGVRFTIQLPRQLME